MPDNLILGIHDGHNATACLLRDGEVVAAVSEERISRIKNESGYPRRAIETVLEMEAVGADEIDTVALGSRFMHTSDFFQGWDWYRKGFSDQLRSEATEPERREYYLGERLRERKLTIEDHLGITRDRVEIVEHHTAHAAAAYFASPWAADGKEVLVLTLDGSGDGKCATVSVGRGGELKRISETPSAGSIGKVYSRVTFLLGMKPWEHEYKVMGLAPYADEEGVERALPVLEPLVRLPEGSLVFEPGTHLSTNFCYPYLRSNFENYRFDWIAGAIQHRTEELVIEWVRNAIRETGISRVACGGGVFMNVKANMRLLEELGGLDDLFVVPSCGDESIAMGAAYQVHVRESGGSNAVPEAGGIDQVYWGPGFSDEEIERAVREAESEGGLEVERPDDVAARVGELLAGGEIVAVFGGRMEWGARALGNRSILVDPRDFANIREINTAIKERDFWMPFAPSILAERADDYLINEKDVDAPYMILAFRSTPQAREDLIGAMHSYDFTLRPQLVERDANPTYHRILKEFERRTGVGGVLNTSFNIHGEPIVCAPAEALDVLRRSGLEWLRVGPFVVHETGR